MLCLPLEKARKTTIVESNMPEYILQRASMYIAMPDMVEVLSLPRHAISAAEQEGPAGLCPGIHGTEGMLLPGTCHIAGVSDEASHRNIDDA